MSKHFDDNLKQSRNEANWTRHTGSGGSWWDTADLRTPHGIATAYIDEKCCSVDFIWEGRWRRRTWNRQHTRRGLAILAGRFINEIINT